MLYTILESANKFHVLSNLSGWHFSTRTSQNKYLLEKYGPLDSPQQEKIKELGILLQKHGRSLTYPFFQKDFSFTYPTFKDIFTQEEFIQLKDIFDYFEPWWQKVWAEERGRLEDWKEYFDKGSTKELEENILKDLEIFFGSRQTKVEEVVLLISNPGGIGGGANLQPGRLTLECSGMNSSREPQIKAVLGTLYHEVSHKLGREAIEKELAQHLKGTNLDFLQNTKFEEERSRLGIKMKNIFTEAVIYSLFPTGYLGNKYFQLKEEETYQKIFEQKTYNPPFLVKWGSYACHFLIPVVDRYFEEERGFDSEFLRTVAQVLNKFVELDRI